MNNCDKYQELISRLVDGELSRDEYAALDAHMENCAECSAMYAVFASLSDIIGGEDEPLPEDLHENIMAGVRRSAMINHNRRRLSKPVRNALTAAACAALVLFASRGLAPEKAADTAISRNQAMVMDTELQQPEEAPAAAQIASASPAPTVSPAASAAPAATASPKPVASPKPTKDIYLESEKTEAKPAAGNTNNATNSVTVTQPPVEITVDTPTVASTPVPTEKPSQVVTITAAPGTPAPVQPADVPAVVAEAALEPEEAAPLMTAAVPETETQPAPAAEEESSAPAALAEPEEIQPEETESPSLSKRLFSFFAMRPTAENEEAAPQSDAAEAQVDDAPVNSIEAEAGTAEAPASPAPAEEAAEEEEDKPIKLESLEKLTELENLLDGEEAELPAEEADEEYSFVLAEPEEGLEEYEIRVYIHGETVYYVQVFSAEDSISCMAPCKAEDFEKFMDSLSDREKGIEPTESPAAAAVTAAPAEPELSPEPTPELSQPEQSPAASAEVLGNKE